MASLDERIDALKPGESLTLSEMAGIKCVAERTGDGKTLNFVRLTDRGFEIFRSVPFAS